MKGMFAVRCVSGVRGMEVEERNQRFARPKQHAVCEFAQRICGGVQSRSRDGICRLTNQCHFIAPYGCLRVIGLENS
jgi:hypothetical protein